MIIKKLFINSFGKLQDKHIVLEEGLNIIYGENEAGKSTVQAYIKGMLFGLSAKRSKNVKANDRIKFSPLQGGRAAGEMVVVDKDKSLLLKRSFGTTKKEDESEVIDEITGEVIQYISKDEPGRDMIGINAQSFENTLFIRQLGTKVQSNKEDEVLHKITNTFQSGEEGVSYHKAQNNLENLRKQLVTSRKSGKLDLLRSKFHKLTEERYIALRLSEENIHNELKLIDLKEHREFLNKEIKRAEISKKYLKKIKLREEYKEITDYLRKSQELKKRREEVEGGLITEEGIVDIDFVNSLREETKLYFNLKDILEEREKKLKEIKNQIEEKNGLLEQYKGYEELPTDIEKKVIKLSLEIESLEERNVVKENIKKDIRLIEKKIEKIKDEIPRFKEIEKYIDRIEEDFSKYEDVLRNLKFKIENKTVDYALEKKLKAISSKLLVLNIVIGINVSVIMLILIFMIFGKITNITGMYLSFISMVPLIGIILLKNQFSFKAKELQKKKGLLEEIENLKQEVKEIEERLNLYVKDLGVTSYEELGYCCKNFRIKAKEIEFLKMRIEEKKNNMVLLTQEASETKLQEGKTMLKKLIAFGGAGDVEEFLENIKEYKVLKDALNLLNLEAEGVTGNLKHIKEDMECKEENIKEKLKVINLSHIQFHEIFDEVEKIIVKLKQREEIESTLKASEEAYKVLLKDRDIEAISEELQEFLNDTQEFSYESEEELEKEMKEKQQDLLNTEKEIKDVENAINNAFIGKRTVVVIEEDLEKVKEEIEKQEKNLKALDAAILFLEESFKEVQKSFGPVLNNKVGEVFSKLTSGSYGEVKVSESYELKVRSTSNNELMSIDYLSNGTWDQVYLSLRIALINLIFGNEKVPIILDEAFVQYDDIRLQKALDLLLEISKHKQIILFTCQKREIEYLRDKDNVNYISL
jgi:uncharacterized protein YhaN